MSICLRRLLLSWVLFGFAVACAASMLAPEGTQLQLERVPNAAEERYNAGLDALERKDLAAAEAAFQASRALDRAWSAPLLGLAEVELRRKNWSGAGKLLQEALAAAPDEAPVQTAWGRFEAARGHFKEAEAAYTRAVQLAPDAIAPRLDLGGLYANALHQSDKAVNAFEAAIRIQPDHAGAHHGLGMALIAAGDIDRAKAELQRAAQLAPDNPLPRHALGRLYASQGDWDQALAAYTDALRVQPRFAVSLVDRGNLFLRRGQWQQAKQDFAAAVDQVPADAGAQLGLGLVSQQLGETERARSAYLAAIQANPKLALAYNNLAWMDAAQETPSEQATAWARRAVELSPDTAGFRDTLGWLLHLRGDDAAAREQLEAAARIRPSAPVLYHLGRVYAALGQREDARSALTKALSTGEAFDDAEYARALLKDLE